MSRSKAILALVLTRILCLILVSCSRSDKESYTPGDSMAPSVDPEYGYGQNDSRRQ